MIDLKTKDMRYTELPDCWEEMTPRQYKYLLKSFYRMMQDPEITPRDVLCDFADFMLGRRKFLHPLQQERYLALVFQVADAFEWIFEEDEQGKAGINYCTTVNLLPTLKGLAGPASHGSDLTFGEYRSAVEFYNSFTTTHETEALDALVGILYRKPSKNTKKLDFDGSTREPFNKNLMHIYVKRVAGIPEYLKYGVYLWFGHLCRFIVDGGEFIIEGNEICFSGIFDRTEPDPDAAKENSIGMLSVLFTLAETGTFGNAKQTDGTELFKVLLKLLHDKETADKLRRS